ncbi:hypothetical protein GGG16DRAFT_118015 [Schizophyllum commune]
MFMKSIVAPILTNLVDVCPHSELSTPQLIFTMISHPQADPRSLGLLDLQALYVLDEELSQTLLRSLALLINLEVLQLYYDPCQPATPHLSDALLKGLSLAKHHGVPPILPLLSKLSFGLEPHLSADDRRRRARAAAPPSPGCGPLSDGAENLWWAGIHRLAELRKQHRAS